MSNRLIIRLASWLISSAMIATFTVAGLWEARRALADRWTRQDTAPAVRKAIHLEPESPAHFLQLAALTRDTDPQASRQALHSALALNPSDATPWIELGLLDEASGDLAAAERSLLVASRVDRMYLPRWTLANYYFRRNNLGSFWQWAREALDMAYADPTPLFSLCWKMTADEALIARNLDIRKASREADYLTYLTRENRTAAIARSAQSLLAWNREADTLPLMAACDRLISGKTAAPALVIWNRLSEQRHIPYASLHPEAGHSLTNGDFDAPPDSEGFGWRLPHIGGVTGLLQDRPRGLRLTFSGQQPENCEVLTQYLPLLDDTRYLLRYRYRTSGLPPATGLAWQITDLQGETILGQTDWTAAESESTAQFTFKTPRDIRLALLALSYRRTVGTTRIEGSITLQRVELERLTGR